MIEDEQNAPKDKKSPRPVQKSPDQRGNKFSDDPEKEKILKNLKKKRS